MAFDLSGLLARFPDNTQQLIQPDDLRYFVQEVNDELLQGDGTATLPGTYTPTLPGHIATKAYVDNAASGSEWLEDKLLAGDVTITSTHDFALTLANFNLNGSTAVNISVNPSSIALTDQSASIIARTTTLTGTDTLHIDAPGTTSRVLIGSTASNYRLPSRPATNYNTQKILVWTNAQSPDWMTLPRGLQASITDNRNGTYTFDDGDGGTATIDTRASSNPIIPPTGLAGRDVQTVVGELNTKLENLNLAVTSDNLLNGGTVGGQLTLAFTPTDPGHAVTKNYVDTSVNGFAAQIANKLDRTGDTMTGPLTLVGAPTTANQAATKQYVDNLITPLASSNQVTTGLAKKLNIAGGAMTGTLTLNGDPTRPLEAATKRYVDGQISGLPTGGTMTDNGNGTYTYDDGSGTTVTLDTRAASNAFANSGTAMAATNVQNAIVELKNAQVGISNRVNTKLDSAGGAISGPITYNRDPVGNDELVRRRYVDTQIASIVHPGNPTMNDNTDGTYTWTDASGTQVIIDTGAASNQVSTTNFSELSGTNVQAVLDEVDDLLEDLINSGAGQDSGRLLGDVDAQNIPNGFYAFDATSGGTMPTGVGSGNLMQYRNAPVGSPNLNMHQMAWENGANSMYLRSWNTGAGTWNTWEPIGGGSGSLTDPIIRIGGPLTTDIQFYNNKYSLPDATPPDPGNVVMEWVDGVAQFTDVSHWKGTNVVGRTSDLASLTNPQQGQTAMVRFTNTGQAWDQMFIYDNGWKPVDSRTYFRKGVTPTNPNQANEGDLVVNADQHSIQVYDDTGSWSEVLSESLIRSWAAAGSGAFQGILSDTNAQGGLLVTSLPTVNTGNRGQYWVVGNTFTVAVPGHPLDGQTLKAGDWIQSLGDPALGLTGWGIISGDLINKSRGDDLYGLYPWASGQQIETGAMVSYRGKVWRATANIAANTPASKSPPGGGVYMPAETGADLTTTGTNDGNIASEADVNAIPSPAGLYKHYYMVTTAVTLTTNVPNVGLSTGDTLAVGDVIFSDGKAWHVAKSTTVDVPEGIDGSQQAPWQDVGIGGSVPVVTMATRPVTDNQNTVYLVLDDPSANGMASLQRYDPPSATWQLLGGSASTMSLNIGAANAGARIFPDVTHVSETPPVVMHPGKLWYKESTNELYIRGASTWNQLI